MSAEGPIARRTSKKSESTQTLCLHIDEVLSLEGADGKH